MAEHAVTQAGMTGVPETKVDSLPAITVVVIGRNEGPRLRRCLESVRDARYPADRIELIYVDSDSSDGSCAVAEELGARVIAIRPERPCAAEGRNTGLRAASHDIIQFLDGDTVLHADWLMRAVDALRDPAITCVHGWVEELEPNASVYNFWAHHDWYVTPGRVDFSGGVAMYRREPLQRAGGYDRTLIAGEERDLSYRLIRDQAAVILHIDAPMVKHDIHMTRFAQYWRRCFRAGYAYAEVSTRHHGLLRWRRTCQRNFMHAGLAVGAAGLSLGLFSP